MHCKIRITCKICRCSAEIGAISFQPSQQFICPNCGQTMPDGIYSRLTTAMTALRDIPEDTITSGWENELKQGFLLSVSGEMGVISPNQ